ncbi:CobW family GTP-binding protein [Paenibacillus xerothermodurans]|uniref:GTP-binding protein n=1 Tax=Paenibacillus xerothermodurans TaxID=1977292 RepID=A0A2W1NDT5_PAEXE|nr:CobW family GTP-binding protein [Paenibacillus xerothermodurans]PZE21770.1 GTP-binding protein [Paenibacillus xerothermodurans]
MRKVVPVHILSGFLGSGKTTLLTQAIEYYKLRGKKPAVLMNELGDVNLDGMLVEDGVPMTEMLSGCICCTIRGDLGMELRELILENDPDVVLVECTGAANPIEIIDGVTDASLLTELELASVITVIDAAVLLERHRAGQGKTYRLMKEQIRCASQLILNKVDLVEPAELHELQQAVRSWNPVAPLTATVRCDIDFTLFDRLGAAPGKSLTALENIAAADAVADAERHLQDGHHNREQHDAKHESERESEHRHRTDGRTHGHHADHQTDDSPRHSSDHERKEDDHTAAAHHSHDHVMVYTHYFESAIDSEQFESLIGRLPANIYRAKGILRFSDTTSPFMFQYAYREADFMKITPKQEVPNVAVFIGEHFSKQQLAAELSALESAGERSH